jgi:hypothetical protein
MGCGSRGLSLDQKLFGCCGTLKPQFSASGVIEYVYVPTAHFTSVRISRLSKDKSDTDLNYERHCSRYHRNAFLFNIHQWR